MRNTYFYLCVVFMIYAIYEFRYLGLFEKYTNIEVIRLKTIFWEKHHKCSWCVCILYLQCRHSGLWTWVYGYITYGGGSQTQWNIQVERSHTGETV